MTASVLRLIVADDERPARRYLLSLLRECRGVTVEAEASSGTEAIELITRLRPDLALLDLKMPECGGLDVVRRLPTDTLPVVAFVTAFDDFAVEAFELNAVDYLLKPPQLPRMQAMIERARQRLARREPAEVRAAALTNAAASYERASRRVYLERIPVRRRDEVFILPVRQIAYVMADGELLHFHTVTNERHTIAHRLHALEARLDPRRFVRLGRGIIVNVELVTKLSPMPGGTLTATLSNGVELPVSRIQTRLLRETLLKL